MVFLGFCRVGASLGQLLCTSLASSGANLAVLAAKSAVSGANLAVLGANLGVLGIALTVLGAKLVMPDVPTAVRSTLCHKLQKH